MAFVTLRRSRNTCSYYLVESYRDDCARSRKRTLCYLGREQDGTDTLEKALAHWQQVSRRLARELKTVRGERRSAVSAKQEAAARRIALLTEHVRRAAAVESERRERLAAAELERVRRERMAELAEHWQAIERLRRHPNEEHARAAKRAFRHLAMRLHPDQGGTHEEFLRLKDAYDRAEAVWRFAAA